MEPAVTLAIENTSQVKRTDAQPGMQPTEIVVNKQNKFWVAKQGVTDDWEDGDDL